MNIDIDVGRVRKPSELKPAVVIGKDVDRILEVWLVRHKGMSERLAIKHHGCFEHLADVNHYSERVQLSRLVQTWQHVRSTRSRTAKISLVAELLGDCPAEASAIVVSYLSGELPQGRIGLGWAAVGAADAAPATTSEITVAEIDQTLTDIKATTGAGSKKAKHELLMGLLGQATADEQEFLSRLLLGGLRQGALQGIMVDAVAMAAGVAAPLVRRAAMVSGDLAGVATAALTDGAAALDAYRLQLFTAVQPMLAQTATSVDAALDKIDRAAVEWKIDGARVQVHRLGDEVKVFTRNLRDVTASSPDLVQLARGLDVSAIILDGEAVARSADNRPVAFQDMISRFSAESDGRLSVSFFDCLHLNGTDLIDLDGEARWQAMEAALPAELLIQRLVTNDPIAAQQFFDDAIDSGYEGVMVKSLDATYEAGRRGAGWLKVKPVHTLDLVVLAVEWGSGRRQGWLSNIHLGARDPDKPESFIMLGKTFKGMTDEILQWQTERFLELETSRDGHIVHVRPEQVVEIAVDGIQRSTRYPGGVALRFARVKGYRDDKGADEADTIETVRALGK